MVGLDRLELSTLRLSGVRSNHLSYRPPKPSRLYRRPLRSADASLGSRSHRQPMQTPIRDPPVSDEWKEKRRRRRSAPILVSTDVPIGRETWRNILRKEVIQPQVPLRLPCYDFTPVADPTVVGCLHCWLAHRLRVKPTPMV